MKSLKLKQLTPLLQQADYRFVSLQYGDDGPHLEKYRKTSGIEVIHDDTIDHTRHGWLVCQVAAMDAVSVLPTPPCMVLAVLESYALPGESPKRLALDRF